MKKDWMIKESQLDKGQREFIYEINDKSCIVMGSAGSGKSVMALFKAQRIQTEKGDNYKIIIFTKSLCNYMNSGREELKLHNISIYHWQWKYCMHCSSADYIIVDEIQDFDKDEIQEFINAANKNFFFFGDSYQSIYQGVQYGNRIKNPLPISNIRGLMPDKSQLKEFNLYYNYRLPVHVAEFVQYVGIGLPPFDPNHYLNKEISVPYMLCYNNVDCQISAIKEIYEDEKKRTDSADVAVLLPKNDMVEWLGNRLRDVNVPYEWKYQKDGQTINTLNFNTPNLKIMTYASAKGLQFEKTILPFVECFINDNGSRRKQLYVAMTRTYKDLYIMYCGVLPPLLQGIPKNLYKAIIEDEIIEDL